MTQIYKKNGQRMLFREEFRLEKLNKQGTSRAIKFNLNSIELKWITRIIGLVNLTCNLFGYEQMVRLYKLVMSK